MEMQIAGAESARAKSAKEIGRKTAKWADRSVSPIRSLPASKVTGRKAGGVDQLTGVNHDDLVDSRISAQADAASQRKSVTHALPARGKKSRRETEGKAKPSMPPSWSVPSPAVSAKADGVDQTAGVTPMLVVDSKLPRRKAVGRVAEPGLSTIPLVPLSENSVREDGGVDHGKRVTHTKLVDSKPIARHGKSDIHGNIARTPAPQPEQAPFTADGGHPKGANHQPVAPVSGSPSVIRVMDMCRQRTTWLKAEMKLTLQCSGMCRAISDDDKIAGAKLLSVIEKAFDGKGDLSPEHEDTAFMLRPLMSARLPLRAERDKIEKLIKKEVRNLPAYEWVKGVKGFGDLSFGTIIGETGDLSGYANPAKVWKRMGLAVIGDVRQGNPGKGASADDWTAHGYVSRRRSVMWNAGNGVIGGMGRGPRLAPGLDPDSVAELTEYQRLFVRRIRIDGPMLPRKDGATVIVDKESGAERETFSKHAGARAKRYVEKRVLRDLWRAWRRAAGLPVGEPHPDSD